MSIEKSNTPIKQFRDRFRWLAFEAFLNSDGYGFQLYFPKKHRTTNHELSIVFQRVFGSFLNKMEISLLEPQIGGGGWGDFCLDTWNFEEDTYDYDPRGKSRSTASYLKMLQASNIEPSYNGLCRCNDWDHFLSVTVACVMNHKAPYSFYFYCLPHQFIFYFHHTRSFGVYYHRFNEAIMKIFNGARANKLELYNWNDKDSIALLSV